MAISREDKMRIQTLREQGLGAKAIRAAYPQKGWKLETVKLICRRVDETGSAVERKKGSGRPKSARSAANMALVQDMICSQDDDPLDFLVWGAMLAKYEAHAPKPKTKADMEIVLQTIWEDLPQEPIERAILSFRRRLQACIKAKGGHFEHLL